MLLIGACHVLLIPKFGMIIKAKDQIIIIWGLLKERCGKMNKPYISLFGHLQKSMLLPVVNETISLAWGVKDDLRKLMTTLESIQALISDPEEKQAKDATVRLWLKRLKGVVYDADDLMDEFIYETMRRREMGSQLKHKIPVSMGATFFYQAVGLHRGGKVIAFVGADRGTNWRVYQVQLKL
ncbi:uncharacterized protein LOC113303882 isoform X2 [Papaver somniferum]|uniref:uncharacterized protein LOC113303882 isoform X2 n=1 Tax=Papaver somniferum TaxID=3469 RepID=UPI000E7037CA|nr:uncharacterized protein LOC113303882 isoform X2 [Papaver somniferum]